MIEWATKISALGARCRAAGGKGASSNPDGPLEHQGV